MREDGKDVVFTILCLGYAMQLALDFQPGYTDCSIVPHLTFWMFHANVFHLAANMLTAMMLRYDLRTLALTCALTIALSFVAVSEIGIQSTLFQGRFSFWKGWFLVFLMAGIAIPNVNGMLHLLCFIAGLGIRLFRKLTNDIAKAG